jgi:uncharacterized membrane protein
MTQETARLEAFSDSVFAIAVTLLVLDLKVPHDLSGPELRRALVAQWPSYAAFLVSFATIGIMWLHHHRLFTLIHRVDHTLLMLNGLLLLTVTVVPFPTALVSAYLGRPGQRISALVYSGCFVVIAVAFNALWRYAASPARQPPLLRIPVDSPEVRAIHAAYRFGPFWYLAAVALSFWHPTVALAVCGLLALFFALPPKLGLLRPPGSGRSLDKPTT